MKTWPDQLGLKTAQIDADRIGNGSGQVNWLFLTALADCFFFDFFLFFFFFGD